MSSDESILTHPVSQVLYYFLLSTIPFYIWRQVTPVIPVDWYITIALGGIVSVYLITRKEIPAAFFNNLNKWLILFFIVNFISSLLSPYPGTSQSGMITLFQIYVFIFLNIAFLTEKGIFTILPVVLAVSSGMNGMFAGLDYFFGVTPFYEKEVVRAFGLTLGANNLSFMSLFAIPPITNKLFNTESPRLFFFYGILILFNIAGLVSSESRGGFLVLCIMVIMILIINRHRFQPRFFGLIISVSALFMVLIMVAVPKSYFERQQSLLSENKDASIQRRTAYITVAMQSFWENPVLGTGTSTFPQVWLNSRQTLFFEIDDRGVHNTYLDVLVGSGLIGLTLFFGLLFQVLRNFIIGMQNFDLTGDIEKKEMVNSFFVSFLTVMVYCLLKTLMDHKYFILSLALSQLIFFISEKEKKRMYGSN